MVKSLGGVQKSTKSEALANLIQLMVEAIKK